MKSPRSCAAAIIVAAVSLAAGGASIQEELAAKGYAIVSKHYTVQARELNYANGDIVETLKLSACRGEREPVTITLIAGKDIRGITAAVTPLRGPGDALPAGTFEVRYQKPQTLGEGQAKVDRQILQPMLKPVDVAKDSSLRLWLTAHVPEGTEAGTYSGTVVMRGNGISERIPIALHVYDFDYGKLPGRHAVMIGVPDEPAYYRDCAEHGMTAICSDAGGALETSPDGRPYLPVLERNMKMAMEAGLGEIYIAYTGGLIRTSKVKNTTHILQHHDYVHPARMLRAARAYRAICKEKGYPEVIWYIFDEPGKRDVVQLGPLRNRICRQVYEQVAEMPQVRTLLTMGHEEAEEFGAAISVHCYGGSPTPQDVRVSREAGAEVWRYSNDISMGTNPLRSRFGMGFYPWRCGWDGSTSWTYPIVHGNTGEDGKPLPPAVWEAVREGVDDWYYLLTLEALMKANAKTTNPQKQGILAKAGEFLEITKLALDASAEKNPWTGEQMDGLRGKTAGFIEELKK
ncbi:MAG: hypothetical protein JW909_00835 [Planctomycetes bacterium]|nr:hypothetical protein [Planctomycetota bacterium]